VTKLCYFCGVLNACATMVAIEKSRYVHQQVIQSDLESDVFAWAVAWLTCMQSVGALRKLRECSTRCHLEM